MSKTPQPAGLTFKAVTPSRWADLERLFESKGGPKYCWCMAWRAIPACDRADTHSRKLALHNRVKKGIPIGILGYVDGEPVAWCSVAPRETYDKLGGHDAEDEDPSTVWSIVCFF